jgi:enoyl-CoA hydratase/carnithine racemase
MNAVTVALSHALEAALRAAPDVADVVLLRGAGGNFSVGGDFKELARLRADGPDAMRELFETFGRACGLIAELPIPVIAVVDGFALAGGFELMQACDIALVADDATLADHHLNFAMIPGGGGSQRLPRLIGRQRALAHLLTGERLSGAEAARLGLAMRALPSEQLTDAAADLASTLASKDRAALAKVKFLVAAGLELPLADALALERRVVLEHLANDGAMDALVANRQAERR